jgi:hypothetical protein
MGGNEMGFKGREMRTWEKKKEEEEKKEKKEV